eukprot:scaffold1153_cov147-Skeletonema_menzelii.AAC.2
MDPLSNNDPFSDEATQTDLDEWLRTTEVFELDVERSRSSEEAAASSAQFPMNFRRQSSLDNVRSDEEAAEPSITIIDLTTDDTVSQPATCDPVGTSPILPHYDHQDEGNPCKRPRKAIESCINTEQILSPVAAAAAAGTGARALQEKSRSCPPTHHSNRDFIYNWQKMSHQDPGQIKDSLPEPINNCNWQKKSHRDPGRTSPPEPVPPTSSSHGSYLPTSFFRSMDEHSSRLWQMMSSSTSAPHEGGTNLSGSAIMSNTSTYNELEGAMTQTRQSRQMILGTLSGITRSDSKNDDSSSANAAATAFKLSEFGMQYGPVDMVGPPLPASSDATTRTTAELSSAEAKRRLERIAKEQIILEKRLAELRRRGFSR